MLESRSFAINHRWLGTLMLSASALVTGCVIEAHNCDECDCSTSGAAGTGGYGGGSGEVTDPEDIVLATIDTNATMETTPGEGIGAFIEYAEGGQWHVYTACDTALSGLPCYFNVIAILPEGSSYSGVEEEGLTSEDEIYEDPDRVELVTVTRNEVDGMYFQAPEGDVVRFEVYLDGELDARFIYWVGGSAVHDGAPTNPIDLKPSEP